MLKIYNRPFPYAVFDLISHLPVPEVIHIDERLSCVISRYVEGTHPTSFSPALSYQLGELLAQVHAITFPFAGLLDRSIDFPENSSPYFEEAMRHLKNTRWIAYAEEHKELFPTISYPGHLVHSDLKPSNMVIQENGELVLLDWEFAHAGAALFDFTVLLRYQREHPLDCDAFVEGYGPLPENWQAIALTADLCNIAELLARPSTDSKFRAFLIEAGERIVANPS